MFSTMNLKVCDFEICNIWNEHGIEITNDNKEHGYK